MELFIQNLLCDPSESFWVLQSHSVSSTVFRMFSTPAHEINQVFITQLQCLHDEDDGSDDSDGDDKDDDD